MQLWVNARLQLNSNSAISIRARDGVDQTTAGGRPELYIHEGRACIDYTALSSGEEKFTVSIGDMMFAAIHLRGDICILRGDGLSSIKLRAGSVQITHAVDPNMIILSESGTEFHIQDDGSYKLQFPGDEISTLEIEKPFVVETVVEEVAPVDPSATVAASKPASGELTAAELAATGEVEDLDNSLASVAKNNTATEGSRAGEPGKAPQNETSGYIYTVYLFSTRDEEVAEEVNRKFQQAGHDTRIFESTAGSVLRYRVVAPGFESRQAAKNFSDAIVGTLGVTQTWIGKDKSIVAETDVAEDAADESGEVVDSDIATGESTAAQSAATRQGELSNYIYTVYLFSTRDEEVAGEVNRKFQQAGHDTRIFESTTGSVLYYRVAASGFESRQAAKNFSDAIVGTLGVTQTWIGKDLR